MGGGAWHEVKKYEERKKKGEGEREIVENIAGKRLRVTAVFWTGGSRGIVETKRKKLLKRVENSPRRKSGEIQKER